MLARALPEALFAMILATSFSLGVRAAGATGRDFVDDILVAESLPAREFGLEIGADSRIDRDYRLQGWFTSELEAGITSRWLLEGVASFVNRGRGLEFGVWHAETRYLLAQEPAWPVSVAASVEYETESRAAKHLAFERVLGSRVVVTRTFAGSLVGTANWGMEHRLRPLPSRATTYAFGARYPKDAPLAVGVELRHVQLEHETRMGPELRIAVSREMTLRLGGTVGLNARPYRFVGRAILETEL